MYLHYSQSFMYKFLETRQKVTKIFDGSFRLRDASKVDLDFRKNSQNPFICDYPEPSSLSTSFTNQFWILDLSVNHSVWYNIGTYSIRTFPYGLARILWEVRRTRESQIHEKKSGGLLGRIEDSIL